MKIIYFSLDYTPHDYRFLAALAETEHQVYYLRLQHGPRQTEDRPVPEQIRQVLWEEPALSSSKAGQGLFRWRDVPGYVLGLRRIIKRIQPDLIHAGPIQTCAFIAMLTGFRPILTMSWGFDLMKDVHRGWGWRQITKYVLRNTTYFTSDAEVTRNVAVQYGMNPEKTTVFPWGVDLGYFFPTPNVKQDASAGAQTLKSFTLFCNRSWEPNYGVDVLARAFARVAAQRPEVGLLLLGGGSQGHIIRQILNSGGVADRVTFAGQVSQRDLPRYYRMADLYISPSHVDGSSVSLMEALACGLPCLVSDIPANKEWVFEGRNGWLFPDGNVDALTAKILAAIDQRKSLPGIGKNARLVAEDRADWKKNFGKLLIAYEKTVSK
ncbi:MAG: glycosyltransferase family 4 protein [Anaerolineales bacterium]